MTRPAFGHEGREGLEGLDDPLDVAVAVEVVPFDVEDGGDPRPEVVERAVVLAGLGDEVRAAADAGGPAKLADIGADDEGRVQAGLLEDEGDPAGRGALAVRAGDGDAWRAAIRRPTISAYRMQSMPRERAAASSGLDGLMAAL